MNIKVVLICLAGLAALIPTTAFAHITSTYYIRATGTGPYTYNLLDRNGSIPSVGCPTSTSGDARPVIQCAADSIPALPYWASIEIGDGQFDLSGSVIITRSKLSIFGQGTGTAIKISGSSAAFQIGAVAPGGPSPDSVEIANLSIYGASGGGSAYAYNGTGIFLARAITPVIRDVDIYWTTQGLLVKNVWHGDFRGLHINQSYNGIEVRDGDNGRTSSSVFRLADTHIEGYWADVGVGTPLTRYGIWINGWASGLQLSNVEIGKFMTGIYVSAMDWMHVVNTLSDYNYDSCWTFRPASGREIKGIQIANSWAGSCYNGFHLRSVHGFMLDNTQVRSVTRGIVIEGLSGEGNESRNVSVTNSQIVDAVDVGIWVDGYVTRSAIVGNQIYRTDSPTTNWGLKVSTASPFCSTATANPVGYNAYKNNLIFDMAIAPTSPTTFPPHSCDFGNAEY